MARALPLRIVTLCSKFLPSGQSRLRMLSSLTVPLTARLCPLGSPSVPCVSQEMRLEKPLAPLSKIGIAILVNGKLLSNPPSKLQWVPSFLCSRNFTVPLQARENNWESVVAILLALLDQLPYEICSAAAVQFVPALNEVCRPQHPRLPVLKYAYSETCP